MKNWKNLQANKCPNCNLKLQFRISGTCYRIKSNLHSTKTQNKNLYFCSKCDGFQITEDRLNEIKKDLHDKEFAQFKNDPMFKSGLLQL